MTIHKQILMLILAASILGAATPAHACPSGYAKCGQSGQLCCPL